MTPTNRFLVLVLLTCLEAVLSATVSCVEDMRCVYLQKRNINCDFSVAGGSHGNDTCSLFPIDESTLTCRDVSQWVTTGKCDYDCVKLGYCNLKYSLLVNISCGNGNVNCRKFNLSDIGKPGPVRDVNVSIYNTSVIVQWRKPDDYDNDKDSYKYTILWETQHRKKNRTVKSRNETLSRKFRLKRFSRLKWIKVTVKAKFTTGGFSSDPVSKNISNPDVLTSDGGVGTVAIIIISVILGVLVVVITVIVICVGKKKWAQKMPITTPKFMDSPTSSVTDASERPLLKTNNRKLLHDSGRGSMETNNTTACDEDHEIHSDNQLSSSLPDTGSEIDSMDTSDITVEQYGEDESWTDAGGSGLSTYRQVAMDGIGNVNEKEEIPELYANHRNVSHPACQKINVSVSIPQSSSEPESVTSYSAMSLRTLSEPYTNSKESKSRTNSAETPARTIDETLGKAIRVTETKRTTSTEVNDANGWDVSGGSCMSAYRQVAADDSTEEEKHEDENEFMSGTNGESVGDQESCNQSSSLQQPFNQCTFTTGDRVSELDLTLSSEVAGEEYEADDSWDCSDGSGVSAYRQVPVAGDDNIADSREVQH